jgi:SAM-dependent methyltransferase
MPLEKQYVWNNADNNAFYEALKAEGLQKFAEKGGLTSCCDLQVLTPYWSKAHSILEVGAGYGRVIDYLLQHQFAGAITAVERCNNLFQYLKTRFQKFKNLSLIQADICDFNTTNRFDLILLLWSAVAEFFPQEQLSLIVKLTKLLQKNGKLVIDTIPENVIPLYAIKHAEQIYSTKIKKNSVYTYVPSIKDIKKYISIAGITQAKHISYFTDIDRKRWLFIA